MAETKLNSPVNTDAISGEINEKACSNIVQAYRAKQELLSKIKSIKKTINEVVDTLKDIKFKRVTLALLSEASAAVLDAAGAFVGQIGSVLFTSLSSIVGSMFEFILKQILALLLSGPEALLSIIAMPLEKARKANMKERKHLLNSQNALMQITKILRKWLSGFGGEAYYLKMKKALPYIIDAIKIITKIMEELGKNRDEDDEFNAFFDREAYSRARFDIKSALDLTLPGGDIVEAVGINQKITAERERVKSNKLSELKGWYKDERDKIDELRITKIGKINSDGKTTGDIILNEASKGIDNIGLSAAQEAVDAAAPGLRATVIKRDYNFDEIGKSLKNNIKITGINLEWESRIAVLDIDFEIKKQVIEIDSVISLNTNNIYESAVDSLHSLRAQFNKDLININYLFLEFIDNMKDAYIQYTISQLSTNSTYNAIGLIKDMMRWFIKLFNSAGNRAGKAVISNLDDVNTLLGAVANGNEFAGKTPNDGLFVSQIKKYERNEANASEMSTHLTAGHISLQMADSILSATVVDSLINLINSDDLLGSEEKRYEEFKKQIEKIVDWDGKFAVWGSDMPNSAMSPYINTIADSTGLLIQIPILLAGSQADKNTASSKIFEIRRTFDSLLTHNLIVSRTLNSYHPYQNENAGAIKKLLDSLGLSYLADMFFSTLSLGGMIKNMINGITTPGLSFKSCLEDYANLKIEGDNALLAGIKLEEERSSDQLSFSDLAITKAMDSFDDINKLNFEIPFAFENYDGNGPRDLSGFGDFDEYSQSMYKELYKNDDESGDIA